MARPVTLCTLQWGDLPLQTVCEKAKSFGFDGLELGLPAHVDVRETDPAYYQGIKNMLDQYGLKLFSISTHLISQAICDRIDERHRSVLPDYIWGDGEEEGIHQRAAEPPNTLSKQPAPLVCSALTPSTVSPEVRFGNGSILFHRFPIK